MCIFCRKKIFIYSSGDKASSESWGEKIRVSTTALLKSCCMSIKGENDGARSSANPNFLRFILPCIVIVDAIKKSLYIFIKPFLIQTAFG